MARPPRSQAAGIRHAVHRGIRGLPIFLDDLDRQLYLGLLDLACTTFGWHVLAWCLMTNHVHLVVRVPDETISRGMQVLSGSYAQAFNQRHGFAGHLFQRRFWTEVVEDDAYGLAVVRYVELNPERARIVADASTWRWSSHRALLGLERPRPFHDVAWTLDQLAPDRVRARAAYADFVDAGRNAPLAKTAVSLRDTAGV